MHEETHHLSNADNAAAATPSPTDPATDAATDAATDDLPTGEIPLPPPLRAHSSLQVAVAAFTEFMLRKGFTDNTMKAFANDLKILIAYFDPATPLTRITTPRLNEFLTWMQYERGKSCSAKTLARRITTLKVFFGWLHEISILGTDPAEPVIQQPARTPLPIVLREEEIARLLSAARDYLWDRKQPDARPYLLISLLLQTGIKKAECANLLVSDIEAEPGQSPAVVIRYREERHAHKNRRLPLDPNILPAIQQYRNQYKPDTFLFDCTPRNLEYVLDEVGSKAGIRSTQVGFETLRWTCAVRDFRNGMPEDRLRDKLGLSKVSWRETRAKIYNILGRHP